MLNYPEIDPVIFSIGFLKIRWYGLMYLIGFVIAIMLAKIRIKKSWSPIKSSEVDDLIFYCMLGVILGGRLGYVIFYGWHQLISDPLYIFRIMEGGMSFHGGLIGVIAALWLYGRKIDKDMITMMDFVAPIVPLGLGFGRIGNFINGELWGKPTNVAWSFKVNGVSLHATQLYEAFLEGLVLFLILWIFTDKERPKMQSSAVFLIGYGVFRFFIEFYRVPDAHLNYLAFGWVTMGQILTAPMIIIGMTMFILANNKEKILRG
jgi:phosphatidylglycerol:prolipoprotein diacylglycerol transferase